MEKIKTDEKREIIDDFAHEIANRKELGHKPATAVIDFRNDRRLLKERDIFYVPTELLQYRKDNGRISSDVLDYEKNHGKLLENSEAAQRKIADFLKGKDKEKTEELKRSMAHDGQREPAIITCDGFLINGNRRKMVLEMLADKHKGDPRFTTMKVVILPGKDEEGGSPTLLEIEQIENRYQLQSEAKAEYYAFDRALSMRRKRKIGMTLEAQLGDDPIYAGLSDKEFKKEVKKLESDYLKPLECIDRYLSYLGRDGLYSTVSTSVGDSEGRWQAFYDYYKSVYQKLTDEEKRMNLKINEDEVGKIEDVAFKIIRKREFPNTKAHKIMRDLPKWLKNKDSKKELLKLVDIEFELPKEERFDEKGKEYGERTIDKIWSKKHASEFINRVKKARDYYEREKGQETPITLLEAALNKLNHENMDPTAINIFNCTKAMKLTKQIQDRADELESEFFRCEKSLKKLMSKNKK